MIELNLIEAASQSVSIPVTPVTKETSDSAQRNFPKPLIAVAALLVVIVGFFWLLESGRNPCVFGRSFADSAFGGIGD